VSQHEVLMEACRVQPGLASPATIRLTARRWLVCPPRPGLRSLDHGVVSSSLPCTRLQKPPRVTGLAGGLIAVPVQGENMPLYMYQASYTAKSMAEQLKQPQDPVEVIRPALEELGATVVVAGFPFGEYDVLIVYEAPDDMTAASVAMAVAAAGEVRSGKTTRLLSGQEWLESLRKRRIVTTRKRASSTAADPDSQNSSGGHRGAEDS
jgi:uncharacterized protein with GYD domain